MPRYSTRKQQQQQQEQLENASSPGAEYVPSSSNDSTEDEFEQQQHQQDESTQTHQQHSSSSSQQPMTSSILMISEQEALATDTYSKNGRSGKFNISAKNVPIKIRIASTVSLRSNPVSAELVYEQDGGVVLSPANQPHPLEWSLVIGNNEFTGVATCRILVLSTQHQGSLFQIKLTCQGQSVLSIPIRVISKRSHATRIVERQQRAAQQILGSEEVATTTIAQQTKPNNKRKRSQTFGANTKNKSSKHSEDYSEEDEDSEMTLDAPENEEYSPPVRPTQPTIVIATAHAGKSVMVPTQQHSTASSSSTSTTSSSNTNNEEVLKALNEIKAQQAMMMERMMLKQSTSTLSNPNAQQQQTNIASSTSKTSTPSILDLESSFRALVRAYLDVPIEERASKMRKVAQESFENEQVAAELGQIWYGSHSLSSSGILEITTPQNTTITTNTNTTKTNNTTSSNLSLSSSQFISERQTLTQSTMQLFDFTSLNSFIPQQQQLFSSNNLASVFGNNSNANNNIEFGVPLLSSSTGGQEFTSALQV